MELILQKGLPHQQKAVDAISKVLDRVYITPPRQFYENPIVDLSDSQLTANIREVQKNIPAEYRSSKLIGDCLNLDIKMETGERVIIVTGCINALRSRVSGTLVNMIHALLRVIKYNYCKQCMRSKDVLALQY